MLQFSHFIFMAFPEVKGKNCWNAANKNPSTVSNFFNTNGSPCLPNVRTGHLAIGLVYLYKVFLYNN